MLDHALPDIDSWTLLFSNNGLPVLRVTKRRLEEMRADLDRVDARELARLILQDPIMTVRVLAYIQPLRGRSLQRDITTIASAVMMAGIEPFFHRFSELFTIEDQSRVPARKPCSVLQVIRRAQRAADYAQEWAIWRHDINMEEVRIAALLHDLAEILVWCSAPKLGLSIQKCSERIPACAAPMPRNRTGFHLPGHPERTVPGLAPAGTTADLINDDNSEHPASRTSRWPSDWPATPRTAGTMRHCPMISRTSANCSTSRRKRYASASGWNRCRPAKRTGKPPERR
jgi:hypothetical protein